MSTHTLEELLRQWGNGDLTAEQMIGHIVQHLMTLRNQQAHLERHLATNAASSPPTTDAGK